MEYFEKLREKVGKETILIPGTGAIVLDDEERVLLMLRSDDGDWGLPGGYMDLDETVRESLHRELREELGIVPRDEQLIGIYSGPDFETTHPNGDRTAGVTILFLVRSFDGALRNSEESRELRFFPLDGLPEPLNGSSARFLRDFAGRSGDGAPIIV